MVCGRPDTGGGGGESGANASCKMSWKGPERRKVVMAMSARVMQMQVFQPLGLRLMSSS